jgi:hypothetical protein
MYGLNPNSPDDYIRLFMLAQLNGYPAFVAPQDRRHANARPTKPRKRRLRSLLLATRRRQVSEAAPAGC